MNLDELMAKAEAATPGPWLRTDRTVYSLHESGQHERGTGRPIMVNRFDARVQHYRGCPPEEAKANVALIAALHPEVAKALIRVAKAARVQYEAHGAHRELIAALAYLEALP